MEKVTKKGTEGLEIGAMRASDAEEVLGVLTRGMRDNPLHVAAFGEDSQVRERRIYRIFSGAYRVLGLDRHALVARSKGGAIVGVVGMQIPGKCRPGLGQQVRLLPALLSTGPGSAVRSARWMGVWAKHDPDVSHWHLGPVAVDTHLQGRGVGSNLMRVFCAKMDAAEEDAYLETDKEINLSFYERFGFEVVGTEKVLGVPNWFMTRRARLPWFH